MSRNNERKTDGGYAWESCCFSVDKRFVTFVVQTMIGIGLLAFCAIRLAFEQECDRAAPYWGLIGTVTGFFFRQAPQRQDAKDRVALVSPVRPSISMGIV